VLESGSHRCRCSWSANLASLHRCAWAFDSAGCIHKVNFEHDQIFILQGAVEKDCLITTNDSC